MADEAGLVVAGRYRLVEPLGQGGMGRVWRGHDETLDREVAVKEVLLSPELPESRRETLLRRARSEARAAARLRHSSIVTVHDVVEYRGAPWIVMEYVPGFSLGALIARDGRLGWRRAAEIGVQVAEGLAHAHAAGVIHRDLKPDNILLAEGRSVITDFGIARIVGATTRLTGTHTVVGTPQYMSPEQLDGQDLTAASDMWALGATLYAAVEGRPPFDGETLMSIITAVLAHPPPEPRNAGPLAELLPALLAKDHRYRPDAAATARRLREITRRATAAHGFVPAPAGPVTHHPSGTFPITENPASRSGPSRRALILGAAGIGVAAAGAATAALLTSGRGTVLSGHTDAVFSLAFSSDGRTLASGGRDGTIRLWNALSHRQRSLLDSGDTVDSVALSSDGTFLASGGATAKLWNTATRTAVATLATELEAGSVAFGPDGETLAVGGLPSGIGLWNVASHSAIATIAVDSSVVSLAFGPDGKTLAGGCDNATARLWNVANRTQIAVLAGHSEILSSVAFSPDGRTLASGGFDKTIRLWNAVTHEGIAVLTGHTDAVLSVAFSPDGKTLASGGRDHTVRLWNVATHAQTSVLTGHGDFVESVAFSPDGTTLASAGGDRTIRLWSLRRGR